MREAVLNYFKGDELATSAWIDKYKLDGETTPNDMHKRLAREFAKVETKYIESERVPKGIHLSEYGRIRPDLTEERIYNLFKDFRYIIPQGSVMSQLGDNESFGSISNCLHGDTEVLTREGFKFIKDLEGQTVNILTKGGGWVNAPFKKYGKQKLYELILTKGKSNIKRIYCTKDHSWYVSPKVGNLKKVKVTELNVGDKLHSQFGKGRPKISPIGVSHGISFGDGHTIKNKNFPNNITLCGDSRILSSYFNHCYVSTDESLCEGGSDYYTGLPNYYRTLPDINENKSYLYGWLCGYFAADGNIDTKGSVRLGSVVFDNMEHVRDICGVLGIECSEVSSSTVISNLTNKSHTMHYVYIHKNHLAEEFFILDKHKIRFDKTDKTPAKWKVLSVTETDRELEVYCAEVPVTESFTIEGNILSGNCVVVDSPEDSYAGIMELDSQLAHLMKRRCGVGSDISTLRPISAKVSNSAKTSTGAVSFMNRFSETTREVAQGGRRGALMLTMDIRHPDILEFIKSKRDLSKITGANISIKVNDEFLNAVENDEDYILRFPCDLNLENHLPEAFRLYPDRLDYGYLLATKYEKEKGYIKRVRAKELYGEFIKSNWMSAEPAFLFWDRVQEYSPDSVYEKYKQLTTNPCCFGVSSRVDVLTDNGIKDIKDITSSDKVYLQNENKFVENSGYTETGIQEVYKVNFNNGDSLNITDNHKLGKIISKRKGTKLNKDEFSLVKLSNLRVGDEIRIHNDEVISFGKEGTYDDGVLLGWLSGDGCLSYKNHKDNFPTMYLDFWKDDLEMAEYIQNVVSKLGFNNITLEFKNNGNDVKRIGSSRLTRYYIDKFETNIWSFRKGRNEFLYRASTDFIKGFLNSLFSADGTVQYISEKSRFNISLTSIELDKLKQVQSLLSNFGIRCGVGFLRKGSSNSSYKNSKTTYRLTITGISNIRKFNTHIGFINKIKQNKLTSICEKDFKVEKSLTFTKIKSIEFLRKEMTGCIEVPNYNYFTANSIISGNSEIAMQPFDTCRLMVLNMTSFVLYPYTDDAVFDYELFEAIAYEQQRLADDLIDLEITKIDKILNKLKGENNIKDKLEIDLWSNLRQTAIDGRRTGCGFTGLGDTIAMLGMNYDSEEALSFVDRAMISKTRGELNCTIDLAELRGAFKDWDANKEFTISRLGTLSHGHNDFYEFLLQSFPEQAIEMYRYGRRNISWSTVAPTGTVSIMAQTTSGIEPLFMSYYTRRKKINPNSSSRVDFVDDNGDSWTEFRVLHKGISDWWKESDEYLHIVGETLNELDRDTFIKVIEASPYYKSTADKIDWRKRVELQSIVQKYTTHAISSTINLPSDATTKEISDIYTHAWKKGLKGITVYRDGCRSGVLIAETKPKIDEFVDMDSLKRPKTLDMDLFHVTAMGERFTLIIGLMNNRPYEVFAVRDEIGKHNISGNIMKLTRGRYDIEQDNELIEDITKNMSGAEISLTRLVSMGLRHRVNVKYIVEQLNKSEDFIVSFSKAIARTLKRYIPEGETSTAKCNNCGMHNVIFEEGCQKCLDCGSSKCG